MSNNLDGVRQRKIATLTSALMSYATLGAYGEQLIAEEYRCRGYLIVEKNRRYKEGEIDLIVMSPDKQVVFIEVKTRTTPDFGSAEAVTPAKLRRLRKVARNWLADKHKEGNRFVGVRFDVATVIIHGESNEPEIEIFQGIDHGAR
ncbi:putative endonuclease [Corynebacterium kutscheri]|uniref:UPF0102 protein NCTC949_01878 n=1 Tax=Corynebacterium kutscheri TaxID=35755 RepID=A0A0F6R026_9CORY|nr:YraN family protein [Corynebacterium kutscheri]AKE41477.1 putative endonuclease related to Holliday junction resolvase [Corynebacterium kutscheri]VEH08755.1 putative endonuclease [Corynebacterium kutscheri]VEH09801.1 putative endonuclease [Corynebacterium kutscheri]VEH79884.1 putative endonuclease [Corynebacterium kutscheri]